MGAGIVGGFLILIEIGGFILIAYLLRDYL